VRLHIIGRSKAFDLFPRTHKGKNRCVLRKKHALINSREPLLKSDINLEQSSHVETVALLSHQKVEHVYVPFEPKLKNMRSLERTTYKEIKEWIQEEYGLNVSSLYIAQVKAEYGLKKRENYNKSKKGDEQVVPTCPPDKHDAIVEAFRHFKMID
jgi:hypothetical protein